MLQVLSDQPRHLQLRVAVLMALAVCTCCGMPDVYRAGVLAVLLTTLWHRTGFEHCWCPLRHGFK